MNYLYKRPGWRAISLLLISCALLVAAMPSPQEEDDETRWLWNKQFLKAREEAKKTKPNAQAPTANRTKRGACALVPIPLRIAP
jgi:hypothetical protein